LFVGRLSPEDRVQGLETHAYLMNLEELDEGAFKSCYLVVCELMIGSGYAEKWEPKSLDDHERYLKEDTSLDSWGTFDEPRFRNAGSYGTHDL